MQMQIHLIEGFLQALQMLAGGSDEALAMAHQTTNRADRRRGPERSVQQAHRMQILQPLAVLHVGFAPGHVFDVTGVDQADLQTARFENLEERHPVDAGGLHRHSRDFAGTEPVRQRVQILREGPERTHRLRVAFRRHGHVVDRGPQIDAGGIVARHRPHAACRLVLTQMSRGFNHDEVRPTPRRPGG